MQRRVIFYRDRDGHYTAKCPSLPGCFSRGKTKSEAAANITEAIKAHIRALHSYGLPVPEDETLKELKVSNAAPKSE